jgi:predicted metal-dependent RNase
MFPYYTKHFQYQVPLIVIYMQDPQAIYSKKRKIQYKKKKLRNTITSIRGNYKKKRQKKGHVDSEHNMKSFITYINLA